MPGLGKNPTDDYVVSASDAIFMKLIRSPADLESHEKDSFHPEFCHQIFGESENIFGFKNLKVLMYYTSGGLKRLISISFDEKIPESLSRGVEVDDILAAVRENIPGPFTTNIDQFTAQVLDDVHFRPSGQKLKEFVLTKGQSERVFEVLVSDIDKKGFREQHEQMQTWLMWFVDAASYIDVDDNRWQFFTLYERTGDGTASNGSAHTNGTSTRYHFAGYCTVYRYWSYPDKMRPRISQFLILPPFQRQGLGTHLLQSIYDHYIGQASVTDIAVEDPAEEFSKLRDYVDARNCAKLPEFSPDQLAKGWSPELAQAAQSKLKLGKSQARRVYEILKLRTVNRSDESAYKNYRLEVKNRLNVSFVKCKRIEDPIKEEVRLATLRNMYEQLEEEYSEVIEKLAAA